MKNIFQTHSDVDSLAQNFAQRAQSSIMVSSRASLLHNNQQYDAAQQIAQFRIQIQKRYIMSVSNKYYSFPLTQLSFDNPFDDVQLTDLIGKESINLMEINNQQIVKKDNNDDRQSRKKLVDVGAVLREIKADRQKYSQILELINHRKNHNHHNNHNNQGNQGNHGNINNYDDRHSKSKQKRIAYKYVNIRQQQDQTLRKRLLTQPNQKAAGFIIKRK